MGVHHPVVDLCATQGERGLRSQGGPGLSTLGRLTQVNSESEEYSSVIEPPRR